MERSISSIVAIPFRQIKDIVVGRMRNLSSEQAEEGLSRFIIVLRLGANKIQCRESIVVVAIGGGRIGWIALVGGIFRVGRVVFVACQRVGNQFKSSKGTGCGGRTP